MKMDRQILSENVEESAAGLIAIIKEEFEKSPSGRIKGYLVLEGDRHIIQKKEIRHFSRIYNEKDIDAVRGSVICREPNEEARVLVAALGGYLVYLHLRDEFKDYPFKKFETHLKMFPEYRYYPDKIWKDRKTNYEVPFFKADIRW